MEIEMKKLMYQRSKKMLARFNEGLTLQKMGDEFGITRERVRQILKKFTGENVASKRIVERKRIREEAREKKGRTVKFICRRCLKPMTYGEAKRQRFFCSPLCEKKYWTTARIGRSKCDYCGGMYSPYRVRKWMHLNRSFCCVKHYNLFRHDVLKRRDAKIIGMRNSGVSYSKIMKKMGYKTLSSVYNTAYKARKRLKEKII